jgi:hypothetical protein
VHLVGFYSLLSSLMLATMNPKFISAKQAKEVYEYKYIKQKLHKTTAATWFNNPTTHGDWRLYVRNWEAPDDGRKSARNM